MPRKKTKTNYKGEWLARDIISSAFYYKLVLCNEDYEEEIKRLGVKYYEPLFDRDGRADAIVLKLKDDKGGEIAIVGMRNWTTLSTAQIVGLLAHEAVHLFDYHCELIGEDEPSEEFKCYSIQKYVQSLFQSWQDQTKNGKVKKGWAHG